jgi:hypothetical protein
VPCRCEIKQEGQELKLVADCRSCKDGKGDLDQGRCFSGILEAWSSGLGADTVVLSGTIEAQYSGPAVGLIQRFSEIIIELEGLGRRRTEKGKQCEKCTVSPSRIFNGLRSKIVKDVDGFYIGHRDVAARIWNASFHDKVCATCLKATKDDMSFMHNRFEELLRFSLKEGFSIVF